MNGLYIALQREGGHFLQLHFRPLLHGLLQQLVPQLRAGDGEEAGEIFHLGGPGDLPAEGVFLDDQDGLPRPAAVGGSGESGRAAADNDDIVHAFAPICFDIRTYQSILK